MGRDYVDWTDFNDTENSLQLLENSVRKSISYDAYGEQKVFRALVLSPARRITNTEGAGLGVVSKEGISVNSPMYRFKARILGDNSPHITLPDPCDLAVNSDPRYVEAVIEMHIDVVMTKTGIVDPPGAGDVVLIELQKNDMSYDLQKAKFLRSVARNVSAEPFLSTKGCSLTFENFDNLEVFVDTPLPLGGEFVDFVPVTAWPVVISAHIANFITKLRTRISKDQIRLIYITSGTRTPERQALAISKKRTIHKCESGIVDRPVDGSPCWPIFKLYKNKDQIMEVLRVQNSVPLMASVFQRQLERGDFISPHMTGRAMDLGVNNLTSNQLEILKNAIESLGGSYLYEDDPPHVHVQIPASTSTMASNAGSETEDYASTETQSVYEADV